MHPAGFCIWPSKFSNYTIAHSPTIGHRDLVREFVDECRAQGIQPGFYFTTGAWIPPACNATGSVDGGCLMEYQRNQITELATEYGEIAYWWCAPFAPQKNCETPLSSPTQNKPDQDGIASKT